MNNSLQGGTTDSSNPKTREESQQIEGEQNSKMGKKIRNNGGKSAT